MDALLLKEMFGTVEQRRAALVECARSDSLTSTALLRLALTDSDPLIRSSAVERMISTGKQSGDYSRVRLLLFDPSYSVRCEAVEWIGNFGSSKDVAILLRIAWQDPDPIVQKFAWLWLVDWMRRFPAKTEIISSEIDRYLAHAGSCTFAKAWLLYELAESHDSYEEKLKSWSDSWQLDQSDNIPLVLYGRHLARKRHKSTASLSVDAELAKTRETRQLLDANTKQYWLVRGAFDYWYTERRTQ